VLQSCVVTSFEDHVFMARTELRTWLGLARIEAMKFTEA
jgi:hypothetical protein